MGCVRVTKDLNDRIGVAGTTIITGDILKYEIVDGI